MKKKVFYHLDNNLVFSQVERFRDECSDEEVLEIIAQELITNHYTRIENRILRNENIVNVSIQDAKEEKIITMKDDTYELNEFIKRMMHHEAKMLKKVKLAKISLSYFNKINASNVSLLDFTKVEGNIVGTDYVVVKGQVADCIFEYEN